MGTARSRTPPLAVMEKGSIETGLHSDSDRQKTCSYRFSAGFVILKQQCHHVPHRSFEGCFNRPGGACIEILQLVQLPGTGKRLQRRVSGTWGTRIHSRIPIKWPFNETPKLRHLTLSVPLWLLYIFSGTWYDVSL